MPAVLDAHAATGYLLDASSLSDKVFSLIDTAAASGVATYISAVSLVEVVYLVERGRIAADAFDRFARELGKDNPTFRVFPLDQEVAGSLRAIPRNIVPTVITANARDFERPAEFRPFLWKIETTMKG